MDVNKELSTLFGDTIGPFFLGFICSCALCGWYMSQVWTYYRQCRQDRIGVQLGVGALTALVIANVIASADGFYQMLIKGFDKPTLSIPLSFYIYYLISPITVGMVQLFFIYRLYLLLERRKMDRAFFILTAAIGIAANALGIEFATNSIRHRSAVDFDTNRYKVIGAPMSGLCVLCDALITWSLCRGLAASRNGFVTTERTIQGITTYILNRGIVLLLVQLASFVAFLVDSPIDAFLFFPGVLANLYANSLVSFLIAFEPRKLSLRAPSPDAFGVSSRGVEGPAHLNIHLGGVLQTTDLDVSYDPRIRDSIVPQDKLSSQC